MTLRKRRGAIPIEATSRGLPFFMKQPCMNSNYQTKAMRDTPTLVVSLSPGPAFAAIDGGSIQLASCLCRNTLTTMPALPSVNTNDPYQWYGFSSSDKRSLQILRIFRLGRQEREYAPSAAFSKRMDIVGKYKGVVRNAVVRLRRQYLVRGFVDQNSRHPSAWRQPHQFGTGVISMARHRSPH